MDCMHPHGPAPHSPTPPQAAGHGRGPDPARGGAAPAGRHTVDGNLPGERRQWQRRMEDRTDTLFPKQSVTRKGFLLTLYRISFVSQFFQKNSLVGKCRPAKIAIAKKIAKQRLK